MKTWLYIICKKHDYISFVRKHDYLSFVRKHDYISFVRKHDYHFYENTIIYHLYENRDSVDTKVLVSNIKILAESLARHVFNLSSDEPTEVFSDGLVMISVWNFKSILKYTVKSL